MPDYRLPPLIGGSARWPGRSTRRGWWAVLVLLAVMTGCAGPSPRSADDPHAVAPPAAPPAEVLSPLADCAGLLTPPALDPPTDPDAGPSINSALASAIDPTVELAIGGGGLAGEPAGEPLPALTLPCFTDDAPVSLSQLRGPAVVNLWASWCAPCRQELPELQRFAERAAGQVHVVGVVTADTRPRAAALAEELAIDFPALHDQDGALLAELAALGLPVTLLVDEGGQVRHVHRSGALTESRTVALVADHLGVSAP